MKAMKLIALVMLLLLVSCSGEPESKYRLEYNEIYKVYRVGEWQDGKWREDGMYYWHDNARVNHVDVRDKASVMVYLNRLRDEESATKKAQADYAKVEKAWRVVQ